MLTAYRIPFGALPAESGGSHRVPGTSTRLPTTITSRFPRATLSPESSSGGNATTPSSNGGSALAPVDNGSSSSSTSSNGGSALAPVNNGSSSSSASNNAAPPSEETSKPWYKKPVVWGVSAGTLAVLGIAVLVLRR